VRAAGTAGISGRGLRPDEALAVMANVNARAEEYKKSDAFGGTPMDDGTSASRVVCRCRAPALGRRWRGVFALAHAAVCWVGCPAFFG
jgi:hypothetical protein